jgi:hypothetical protein
MSDATAFLLQAAKEARSYAQRREQGEPDKGMYEALYIGRLLTDAITEVEAERQRDELFARR